MIYFIQAIGGGPIKIGYTSTDPHDRLRGIQTGSPYKLRVLAVRTGNRSQEQALHHKLSEHRLEGEWFEPCKTVLEAIVDDLPQTTNSNTGEAPGRVAKANPSILDAPDLGDEQTGYDFAQELVRQIVHSYRGEGHNTTTALTLLSEKHDLGSMAKKLWQGGRCTIRYHLLVRIFGEWISQYHPDLVAYKQQIFEHVCANKVFEGRTIHTDEEIRNRARLRAKLTKQLQVTHSQHGLPQAGSSGGNC
jgi:hypothetical protein